MFILLVLVVLHGPGEREIYVNPDAVTTMRAAPGEGKNEYMTDEARCLINTDDGKFISVIETCDTVRHLFEQARETK
jgi:hypothetical protein